MLLGKYQYNENDIIPRGYSKHCAVSDEVGNSFWAKWILGIEQNSPNLKTLADKLRHLQKVKHSCLPGIADYGFDEEQKSYAIVYQYLKNVESLEDSIANLEMESILSGLIDLAECLNNLHSNEKITHGDIHPGNIFVNDAGQFFIIDFQLAEITRTLSREKDLVVFAEQFAAPEKRDRLLGKVFPYQSDIYSFGKVIDWAFRELKENIPEEQSKILQRLCADKPSDRPRWQEVIDFLKKFPVFSETVDIAVDFKRDNYDESVIDVLNGAVPIFDVDPNPNNRNCITDIVVGNVDIRCAWIEDEQKLLFLSVGNGEHIEKKARDGNKLPFKVNFCLFDPEYEDFDLTPYFKKWLIKKKSQYSLRQQGRVIREELEFYRKLLDKELEVINKNSLRLKYSSWREDDDGDLVFIIEDNEKNSRDSFILNHIDNGNVVDSDGVGYILSANANRKQNKKDKKDDETQFSGKPYECEMNHETKLREFKIKDCEHLKKDQIPLKGYLFENMIQKEEEKNRQKIAISKVEKHEVQNTELIYALFDPSKLPSAYSDHDYDDLECVYQTDKNGNPLRYSQNQNKAIRNAINKKPLSVIQGPPGTGKTTVITEIVFQILAKNEASKILITSQTNNAVDQVLENLIKKDIPVVRFAANTAQNINETVMSHTPVKKLQNWKLDTIKRAEKNFLKLQDEFLSETNPITMSLVKNILDELKKNSSWKQRRDIIEKYANMNSKWKKLQNLGEDEDAAIALLDETLEIKYSELHKLCQLHRDWVVTVNSLDEKCEIHKKLIDSIRIVGATCNHIAAKKYNNPEFDYVIMDEASKATVAESLVPIVMGNNLVFVGDHRQLRPMLTGTREVEKWLRKKHKEEAAKLEDWDDYFNRPSLFEMVIEKIDPDYKSQLTECRRLPTEQVEYTSKYFYESEGDERIESVRDERSAEHNLPLAIDSPLFFIDIGSDHKHDKDGTSFCNEESAKIVLDILRHLNKYEAVKNYDLGVIACYTAQFRLLRKTIDRAKGKRKLNVANKLTVSVVDRFQGLERDIIIVDLVKSGHVLNLGFMETPNRINVAFSRNKRLLFIVGDYRGIINAKTRTGEKVALQHYLEGIKEEWVIPAEKIGGLFK